MKKLLFLLIFISFNTNATVIDSSVGLANSGVAKEDIWKVSCNPINGYPAEGIVAMIADMPPVKSAILSVQITNGTRLSPLITDKVDGDFYPPPGQIPLYSATTSTPIAINSFSYVHIKKSGVGLPVNFGAEIYQLIVYCTPALDQPSSIWNISGVTATLIQNQ